MITMNGPFFIALIIIVFLITIKWIEWYLFKGGTLQKKPSAGKGLVGKKDSKLSAFGRKLKGFLFFGETNLKKPWYGSIPLFLFILSNQYFIRSFHFVSWQLWIYIMFALIVMVLFETLILLRANKEFFSAEERRKRFIKTQIIQGILAVLLLAILLIALEGHDFNRNQPDPPGLKESVNWVIEPAFEGNWLEFSEGLAAVGKKGYIDKNGNIVIPFQYDGAGKFQEGLAPVQRGRSWGYIDQKGEVLIPFQYEEAFVFSEGLASVKKDDKWMVIDNGGAVIFETDFEYVYPFHEGVAIVDIRENQSWNSTTSNLIDAKGNLLFQKNYAFSGSFSEGCIPAMDSQLGKGYFLGKDEKKTVPLDFLDAGSFSGGYAPVWLENGKYALIDHAGTIIRTLSEWEYYGFQNNKEGLSMFSEGDWEKETLRYGLKDKYGNIIAPAVFQNPTSSSDGMIGLTVDGRWGFIENPLPAAAREINPELWASDRTQIATVEGLPVYAGELESGAYSIKISSPETDGSTAYMQAFEQIKLTKASEKYGESIDPEKIQYQIGNAYYKKLLLESN